MEDPRQADRLVQPIDPRMPDARHFSFDRRFGIGALATVAALLLNAAVVGIGGFVALGRMTERVDTVTGEVKEIKTDFNAAVISLRGDLNANAAELRREVAANAIELRREIDESLRFRAPPPYPSAPERGAR